jgi:hypothetical protein
MLGHGVGAPLVPPQCVRCGVPPSPVSTGCILSPRDTTQARANAALSCVELLPLYSNRQTGTKRLAKPSKVGVIERMRGSSIARPVRRAHRLTNDEVAQLQPTTGQERQPMN